MMLTGLITVVSGRTVGDYAVRLRYDFGVTTVPGQILVQRLLRFLGEIGGLQLLELVPGPNETLFILLSVILTITTGDRRGLPGLASGGRLVDDAASADATPASAGTEPVMGCDSR